MALTMETLMNWNYVCWIEALQHEVMRVQREALSVALGQQWLVQLQECSEKNQLPQRLTPQHQRTFSGTVKPFFLSKSIERRGNECDGAMNAKLLIYKYLGTEARGVWDYLQCIDDDDQTVLRSVVR